MNLFQYDAYVGNEGGATHIARGLGVPNFSILAPDIPRSLADQRRLRKSDGFHVSDIHSDALGRKEWKEAYENYYAKMNSDDIGDRIIGFLDLHLK